MRSSDKVLKDKTAQFVSTATAARMLGLSTSLVQSLVDRNLLDGWKTTGGHRRISRQSVEDYQHQSRGAAGAVDDLQRCSIVVAMESSGQMAGLQARAREWAFPVKLVFVDTVTEALLILGAERPDMLVIEMTVSPAEQQKTITALDHFNAKGRPVTVVLVTDTAGAVSPSNPLPRQIQVTAGPLNELWLHAFLTGVVASC